MPGRTPLHGPGWHRGRFRDERYDTRSVCRPKCCAAELRRPGLDDVAIFIDENSDVIPTREFFVRTPITNSFAKANHAAGPAGTVSEDEVSGTRIGYLLAGRKALTDPG